MKPLWEMTDEYLRLLTEIEQYAAENAGELPEDLEFQLDLVQSDRLKKLENCCALLKEFEARSEYVATALKTLQARKKGADAAAERLKAYIARNVNAGEK